MTTLKEDHATIPTIPFGARVSRWFGRNLIRIYAVLGFSWLFVPVLYTFVFHSIRRRARAI